MCTSKEFDESETEKKCSERQLDPSISLSMDPVVVVESVHVHVGQSILPQSVTLSSSHPQTDSRLSDQIYSEPNADVSLLTPLSLDEGRYIASLYSLCSSKTSLPSIWIVCSKENRNVVALGTSFINSTLFMYTISLKETIPLDSKKDKFLCRFDGRVFSQYQIASSSETSDSESGSIFVEFYWSEGDHPLCLPPESAHAIVKVSASPGYSFSPVSATYNEMCRLLEFCEILTGDSEWPLEESPTKEDPSIQLSKKIESFLNAVATPFTKELDATVISPTSENTIYETRKDLDFVEHLWIFAKDATSLAELKEIFADVFKALLLGRVQPFVHRTSSSVLASLLHQLLQCTSTEDRQALTPKFQSLLSHTKLLSTLVQIGLDKMKRDYRSFFISSDIATDNQLEDFFTSSSSQSQLAQCHRLCKLHCVLEINASLLSFLNLPSSVLSTLTKTALQVYKKNPFKSFSTTPTFNLPLPPHSSSLKLLISLCSKLHPTLWKAQLDKEQGMIVYRNTPLFGEREDTDMYYVYIAKSNIAQF